MLEADDRGIFRFFLLLVFSKLSYPSAEDAVEPGGGGLLDDRDASTSRRWRLSGFIAVLAVAGAVAYL
jgi:hypothetical protein